MQTWLEKKIPHLTTYVPEVGIVILVGIIVGAAIAIIKVGPTSPATATATAPAPASALAEHCRAARNVWAPACIN